MSLATAYVILLASILCEIVGTSALNASQQFTRPIPSLMVIVFYAAAIVGLAYCFRVLPMGIAYGIWSGLGIVLISISGWIFFGQHLDLPAILGLGLIVLGVVIVNVFSSTIPH